MRKALADDGADLRHLREAKDGRGYTPRETLPSLLVAYQIYGDAGRADEIAARNTPRHPGFLVGGNQLEVLADG